MNKLIKIFSSRPVAKGAVVLGFREEHIPVFRRERLISVWSRDPATGRLICTWRKPSEENGSSTPDAEEPPQTLKMAA
ncbi:hypothetical protein OGR47_01945 [Methylocystis sp. MJC1]|jgi:hypothetical protein|uniref:hypothetical protein n=1 Tax=Methylocystis sp. MJC1 TaxID=2654282 RepID=UPI0013ECA47C|nr:hypothetical protein [Methylocystis sp. MJC1]KAF2990565.1 hypothetical protein MJC1_02327 [Methylocystis sp. MJC1]MBU6525774.1 hypothetical protein [Methylocystis sp. MJC1]UZX12241.1 hypothetical protein OGR47_01945 [Methylocystis sp. MJC1]